MSSSYSIAETESFRTILRKKKSLSRLHQRIQRVVYPILRREPHAGPNIKRLKAEYGEFYRYRIGDYRLFYTIDEQDRIVIVAALRSRQQAYRP